MWDGNRRKPLPEPPDSLSTKCRTGGGTREATGNQRMAVTNVKSRPGARVSSCEGDEE
jgi:hypothetical protein